MRNPSKTILFLIAATAGACASDGDEDLAEPEKLDEEASADPFDVSAIEPDELAKLNEADRLGEVADGLTEAMAPDPSLSNVFVDPDANTVIVYRVGGENASARAMASAVPLQGARVEVRPALVTAAEATALADQIEADTAGFAEAGVALTSWGPDPEGGPFRITVEGDPEEARTLLARRYTAFGPRFTVEQMEAPIPTFGRMNDLPPYWGGARVKMPGGGQCTSGWSIKTTREYLITAAHCFGGTDRRVWNGSDRFIGTASALVRTRWDVAFIPANTAPGIYTDTLPAASSGKGVIGVGSPPDGSLVCLSGSFEQLRCGIRIRGWRRLPLRGTTVDVWNAISTTGVVIVGEGDSGGPAFATRSGRPIARGLISMMRTGSSRRACPAGSDAAAQRVCSNHAYITDMGTFARRYSARFTGF